MIYFGTITSQGQLSIPAEVRRKLDLNKNRQVVMQLKDDDSLHISPVKDIDELFGSLKTNKKIPFKKSRKAFEDYLAYRTK